MNRKSLPVSLRCYLLALTAAGMVTGCGTEKNHSPEKTETDIDIGAQNPGNDETTADVPAQGIEAPGTDTASPQPDQPGVLTNAYFGDLHIHTKNSFDAYIFNVRTTPADVYRFAKGETVIHPTGYEIRIWGDPLDFVAATDHGAYMGILPQMDNPDSPLSKVEMAQDMFGTDQELIIRAFNRIGGSVRSGVPFDEIYDREIIDSAWKEAIDTANTFYEPGKLTTFAGYEYTAVLQRKEEGHSFAGGNLHRNVIFKDAAPARLFSTLDSINPEDLWDWMDQERAQGRDVIAIPHNSNVSDGAMFDMLTYEGDPLDATYASQRIRNEPIVELSQVKGTSETHPALSPNDEWADFEIYELLLASTVTSKIRGSFIREALANGLKIKKDTGVNPYKFGMIGSSDSHVAGGAYDEANYWSKVGIVDGTPEARGSIPPGGAKTWETVERLDSAEDWFSKWSAAGLAGVWAQENTREAIFDAMRRRETFATSGPRIKVRFFASNDYTEDMLDDPALIARAYETGVPMGGTVTETPSPGDADDADDHITIPNSPEFIAFAMRDPRSALLQRLQIVKSWHDGETAREKVFDIACADGLLPDPATHRCPDNGAGVNLETCEPSAGQGAAELKALWRDPEFDAAADASYYVRVLENPTCRWSTWEALRAGVERHPDLPPTLQERAWSSPIWYDAGS